MTAEEIKTLPVETYGQQIEKIQEAMNFGIFNKDVGRKNALNILCPELLERFKMIGALEEDIDGSYYFTGYFYDFKDYIKHNQLWNAKRMLNIKSTN